MHISWAPVTVAAALALGQGLSHAQAPALPDMAGRGVQCQLVEEALFALAQIGPRDGPNSLSVQSAQRLRAAMQPETLRLYESLAKGYRGSDAYDNGAEAYTAAVGLYVDRALRACAQAWSTSMARGPTSMRRSAATSSQAMAVNGASTVSATSWKPRLSWVTVQPNLFNFDSCWRLLGKC